jgi:hypothetical protein
MPDAPKNGGIYLIQNKVTGKQLGLPGSSVGGVFKQHHIIPRDQGAVWELEVVSVAGFAHCYRFKTTGPFPWFDYKDPDSDFGRLESNRECQVFAHQLNDGEFQIWQPEPIADGYFTLINHATGLALNGTKNEICTTDPNFLDTQHWAFFTAPPDAF